ncbi:MAG: sialate O-acetylesterase [Planctomycetes bacterium]|nr:sialate O-acetylesterase [Planctomycetota bacterium]
MKKQALLIALGVAIAPSMAPTRAGRASDDGKHYRVFILAGQSNAQGKAPVSLMEAQAEAPATRDLYKHFRKDGKWIVRDDVLCLYKAKKGGLTVGYGSPGRSGSELEFGWMMGDRFEEPVVIIKTCQGGMSLYMNFRPPSSGLPGEEALKANRERMQGSAKSRKEPIPTAAECDLKWGEWYRFILSDYKTVAEAWEKEFPVLKGRTPKLTGFVWFQGWNDQYGGAEKEYASNMKNFIKDIRKDLNAPSLPFVVAAMGQNGSKPATGAMLTIREAQMAMNDVPEFKGNVKAFRTDLLVDKDAERLWTQKDPVLREREKEERVKFASDDAYHYYGSPIWYLRIGHAMGEAMLELMTRGGQPGRVPHPAERSWP